MDRPDRHRRDRGVGCVRAGAYVVMFSTACATLTPEPSLAAPTATSAPTAEPLPSDLDPEDRACDRDASGGRPPPRPRLRPRVDDRPARVDQPARLPAYPEEEAKLVADQADQNDAVEAIQAYAADHADESAGLYIDRDEHPGVVTAMWTGHLEQHERAISDALRRPPRPASPGPLWICGTAGHHRADQGRLEWMKKIPAKWSGLGVHERENVIMLEISSAEPTAVQQIGGPLPPGRPAARGLGRHRRDAHPAAAGSRSGRPGRREAHRRERPDARFRRARSLAIAVAVTSASASPTTARSSIRVRQASGRSWSSRAAARRRLVPDRQRDRQGPRRQDGHVTIHLTEAP